MLKWARRDRRLALIMLVDLLLAILIGVGLALLLARPTTPTLSDGGKPTAPVGQTVLPAVGFEAITPSPAVPTINPTRLVGLPNQGQNDAPPAPPGLLARNTAVSGNNNTQPQPTPRLTPSTP